MIDKMIKSVLEMDNAPIVICDMKHIIVYMNPSAKKRYAKHGELIGKSILDCHNAKSKQAIIRVVEWFGEDKDNNKVYISDNVKENKDVYMVALRDENDNLIGYYEKHEYRNKETCKLYENVNLEDE